MIATLQQFKNYLWITDNSQDWLLQLLVDSSNQMITTYLWRVIEAKNYIQYIDWNAQRQILLNNYPVNSLDSIKINTWSLNDPIRTTIQETSYKLSPKDWNIFLLFNLERWFQNYKINYNAWYITIPSDLTLASLKLASKYYNNKSSDGIKWETNNWDRIDFDTSYIPDDIIIILDNYRDIYV